MSQPLPISEERKMDTKNLENDQSGFFNNIPQNHIFMVGMSIRSIRFKIDLNQIDQKSDFHFSGRIRLNIVFQFDPMWKN